MLPYIPPPEFHLFGATFHLFGLLVALGVLVGVRYTFYRAKKQKIPSQEMRSAVLWVLSFGFLFAHVFEILFYSPERIQAEGFLVLLKFWDEISSFGGFIGAIIGLMIFKLRLKKSVLPHVDIMVQGLVIGWIFGRLGCTLAFDHPGVPSDFFLAFHHPTGSRHNLGFYEFLYTLFVLFPAALWTIRFANRPGLSSGVILLLYCPVRFALDFLRAYEGTKSDIRYLGLTFAQYACIAFFFLGLWLVWRIGAQDVKNK